MSLKVNILMESNMEVYQLLQQEVKKTAVILGFLVVGMMIKFLLLGVK